MYKEQINKYTNKTHTHTHTHTQIRQTRLSKPNTNFSGHRRASTERIHYQKTAENENIWEKKTRVRWREREKKTL